MDDVSVHSTVEVERQFAQNASMKTSKISIKFWVWHILGGACAGHNQRNLFGAFRFYGGEGQGK